MAADVSQSIVHDVLFADSQTVAVPTLADNVFGGVDVTVAGAALGDEVTAVNEGTLTANAFIAAAYVSAPNTVRLVFGADGAVTGANAEIDIRVYKRS